MGPVPHGGSCEEGNVPAPWEVSSLVGRSAWKEGELQSLRGGSSNQFVEGKTKSNLHRGSAPPPCAPQPETFLCQCVGGLGNEAQALKVSLKERTRVRCGNSLKRLGSGN